MRNVLVPVAENTPGTALTQVVASGWSRRLSLPEHPTPPPLYFAPVVLSGRHVWYAREDDLELFDSGFVLAGAHRLEAAATHRQPPSIPALVYLNLSPDDELTLRMQLSPTPPAGTSDRPRSPIDTATTRLEIRDRWIELRIDSDPFVVPTSLGYAPAILVRRSHAMQREHLLIGARSIARPLEDLRTKYGSLSGRRLRIRKTAPAKTAPYEFQELN